tara:strand:+ start:350 stop:1120 length:771 start_codon:yes stop_codon:yes gene_type:complete
MNSVSISVIRGIPEIREGDPLTEILAEAIKSDGTSLRDGDILCIAHKIISKAEGRIIHLTDVIPSENALYYARKLKKDPRKVEVILRESREVLRYFRHEHQNEGVIICENNLGFISANAGVDESNLEKENTVLMLPENPDLSAQNIKKFFKKTQNVSVGIVITDTFGRPWRIGQVNVAIGIAGVPVTQSEKGQPDNFGRIMKVTEPAFCDEIAAASGLVIKKSEKTPLVIFRGLEWKNCSGGAKDILRNKKEDMFL